MPRIAPAKQEVRLAVESDVPGAAVLVEGENAGTIPLGGYTLCPGRKHLEVRSGERLIWADEVDLDRPGTATIQAHARPTLRLVVKGVGPKAAAEVDRALHLATFNRASARGAQEDEDLLAALEGADMPGGVDPAALRPRLGADLLLAADLVEGELGPAVRVRLASALAGVTETIVCASPVEACVGRVIGGLESPWPRTDPLTGLQLREAAGGRTGLLVLGVRGLTAEAGADRGAKARNAAVAGRRDAQAGTTATTAAPDVREGDRIVEAGGARVATLGAFRAAAASALGARQSATVPLVLERAGHRIEATLLVRAAPVVAAPGASPVPLARLLATADFEASVLPLGEARNAALLTLAAALIGRGEPRRALELALEREGWAREIDGAASYGAARFLAGRCYEDLDDAPRAVVSMRQAAEDTRATFWDPDGLPVAPLARLKLLELASSSAALPPVSRVRSN